MIRFATSPPPPPVPPAAELASPVMAGEPVEIRPPLELMPTSEPEVMSKFRAPKSRSSKRKTTDVSDGKVLFELDV